ncbi:hypothetical protein X474_02205 [Dethiosulfatarculus sandiegensis]|uniref:DUF434 domain-containing protein n=1 Tax=Dethiosulfatarculus sandiegensis TaxID=1429043 RepID=A0A0D2HZ79_9BACT|nr:hypothetical protein X474_02205 [Dethiosulfatarculus sandiegensis]
MDKAARDLRFLLSRGYPRERVLTLVGDRYTLTRHDRHILRRGVFAPLAARARKARLIGLDRLAGARVGVDGHNLLITLETALKGGRLILGDDGVVRDIAGVGSSHKPGELTLLAAQLMLAALSGASAVYIWLDSPLKKSGELAGNLRRMLARNGMTGDARAVPVPEKELFKHKGPVATSDSVLLDQVDQPTDPVGDLIQNPEKILTQADLSPELTARFLALRLEVFLPDE